MSSGVVTFCKVDGGELGKACGIFVGPARVVVDLLDVAGPEERGPVGDAGTFNGGFVAVGLSDGPGSHEAARAPAKDGKAVGVGPSLSDGVIGCAVDVVVGAVAEVLVNGGEEVRAVACGTAVFRLENHVAEAGDGAGEGIEGERSLASGPPWGRTRNGYFWPST